MNTISNLSPAKLNLFLHITGKRDDGYHNLQTVFRLLDWGDQMRFIISQDRFSLISSTLLQNRTDFPVRLHCDVQLTDNPNDNLIIKSAHTLLDFAINSLSQPLTEVIKGKELPSTLPTLPIIDIYLDKKISTGGGLGGGSSNAATTLMALNKLWRLGLSKKELQQVGVTLGADVPIFIYNKDAIAEGVGELFTHIELPKQSFLLLTPSTHISTAELFSHPSLQRNSQKLSTNTIIKMSSDFTNKINAPFCNVFQSVVCELSEEVSEALAYLQQFEPITNTTARMTGSGSSVFLPIPIDTQESLIDMWLKHAPCSAVLANSL